MLGPEDRPMHRALAARCMYLVIGRPDSLSTSKALRGDFAKPTDESIINLTRRVRYLVARQRVIWEFLLKPSRWLDRVKCECLTWVSAMVPRWHFQWQRGQTSKSNSGKNVPSSKSATTLHNSSM